MFSQRYSPDQGWHDARIGPYRPLTLDPATVVFHYGQEIFEGLKAYRRPDGKINLFRPWENAARFNRSAARMAMAEVDPEEHVEAIAELVSLEHEWVPAQPGASLYIRPTLIATDIGLGVHASHNYLHFIIVGPAGPYFATGFDPVAVYISRDHVRACAGAPAPPRPAATTQPASSSRRKSRRWGISRCSGWMRWTGVMSKKSVR